MSRSLSSASFGSYRPAGRLAAVAARGCAAAALLAATAACFDTPAGSEPVDERGALASDSTLARDLTLAGRAGQAAAYSDTIQVASKGVVEQAAAPAPRAPAASAAPQATGGAVARAAAPTRGRGTGEAVTRAPAAVARGADAAPAREPGAAPMANEATVAAVPQPRPTAGEEPGRSAELPTPAPAPSAVPAATMGRGAIAAGSTLAFTTAARVCTGTNAPGDKIVATLDDPAQGSQGFTLAAGTKAVLEVASVERDAGNAPSAIHFRLRNLDDGTTAYPARGAVATLDPLHRARSSTHPAKVGRNVAGGALLGAVAGQVLGRNTKSTVIGAAAGSAAGALSVARKTTRSEACLPAGAKVQVRLAEPVVGE